MASNAPNRGQRSSPLTNEKSNLADKCPAKYTPDCYCQDDEHFSRRYDDIRNSGLRHQGGTQNYHELYKLSEEKTSDEGSITEGEINDTPHEDLRAKYRSFDSPSRKYDKSPREYPKHSYGKAPECHEMAQYEKADDEDRSDAEGTSDLPQAVPTTCQRNLQDYVNSVNLPQALVAMKKLERLKELQRRRDLSERFYSQEIKRLIGEDFFSKKLSAHPLSGKVNEQSNPVERIRAGGFSKELKPCGTVTTITRLDCGCVKETTTPIFNSRMNQIKKCEDHRYPAWNVSKLPSTNPQELTYRAVEPLERLANAACNLTRFKAKLSAGTAANEVLQSKVSRDLESWQNHRSNLGQQRNRRSPRHMSPVINTSPARKYSGTSSNSQ